MRKRRGGIGSASLYDRGKLQALNRLNDVGVKDAPRESKTNQPNLDAFHESCGSPLESLYVKGNLVTFAGSEVSKAGSVSLTNGDPGKSIKS